jgi:uncharacterized membrane protein
MMDRQERMSATLGWFSIGLGMAELLAPRAVGRLIGVKDHRPLPALGVREIVSGVGLLTQPHSAGWMWSRVGGDAMDLSLLAKAMTEEDTDKGRLAMATAAVLGVAALDVMSSLELSKDEHPEKGIAIEVKRSVTIDKPAADLYQYWRNFDNLPGFMQHLESVEVLDNRRSRWVAKAPFGKKVEWEAEITEDTPNERISWRSIDGADVTNYGSVRFMPAAGNRGTVVQVHFQYKPPAGLIGATAARLFGEEPELQVTDDLRAFKQMMELGEVVISEGSLEGGHLVQHPATPKAMAA